MASDWPQIGTGLALVGIRFVSDWYLIDIRFAPDWGLVDAGLAMDVLDWRLIDVHWHWIDTRLAPVKEKWELNWHKIGNGFAQDWRLIDVDWHWIGTRLAPERDKWELNWQRIVMDWQRIVMDWNLAASLSLNRPPSRLEGFPHRALVPLLHAHLSSDWHGMCQFVSIGCQSYANSD